MPSVEDLEADVVFNGVQLRIENRNKFEWIKCGLLLNRHSASGGYTYALGRLKPAASVTIDSAEFVSPGEGERFNPLTHTAQELDISCSTPSGISYYSGRFGPSE